MYPPTQARTPLSAQSNVGARNSASASTATVTATATATATGAWAGEELEKAIETPSGTDAGDDGDGSDNELVVANTFDSSNER